MTKTISAIKARKNLGEILNEVYYNSNDYIICRAGKPMVRLVKISVDIQKKSPKTLDEIVKDAKKSLKADKINSSSLLDNLEKNREEFYRNYLRKYSA